MVNTNTPNTPNRTTDINDFVKIKEDCHYDVNEDNDISAIVESNYTIINKNSKKEVEKCVVATTEGLESNYYRDYDANLDYNSIDTFINDIWCMNVYTGYGLVVGEEYEVNGINFILEPDKDDFGVKLKQI